MSGHFWREWRWRLAVDRKRSVSQRDETIAVEPRSYEADPERAAIASELGAAVQRLIDALPEELRQPTGVICA